MRWLTLFQKLLILFIASLSAVLIFFNYSDRITQRVFRQELIESNRNRLLYFVGQMDTAVDQLWTTGFVLLKDSDVQKLQDESLSRYERIHLVNTTTNRLQVASTTQTLANRMVAYSPVTRLQAVSELVDGEDSFHTVPSYTTKFIYDPEAADGRFISQLTWPFASSIKGAGQDHDPVTLVVRAEIKRSALIGMLNQYKRGSAGEAFMYAPGYPLLMKQGIAPESQKLMDEVIGQLTLQDQGSEIMTIGGKTFLANYRKIQSLDWHVVDLIPLASVLAPLSKARFSFYALLLLLLVLGVVSTFVLNRSVRLPILRLTRGVHHLKSGDYSHRIRKGSDRDFAFLFHEFNQMSADIQRLIETVHFEQIKVREAQLSQLQSQINPHFLYNNFAFIQSMARKNNTEAIITFSQHVSRYYRSATRPAALGNTLGNELELVRNYLQIHAMQSPRFHWEIHVPQAALDLNLPALILQPLVENALIHGVEKKLGEAHIRIEGTLYEQELTLIVEDNGNGMTPQAMEELQRSWMLPLSEDTGCGLWNVHHRLLHQSEHARGLIIDTSELGGLRVQFSITTERAKRGEELP